MSEQAMDHIGSPLEVQPHYLARQLSPSQITSRFELPPVSITSSLSSQSAPTTDSSNIIQPIILRLTKEVAQSVSTRSSVLSKSSSTTGHRTKGITPNRRKFLRRCRRRFNRLWRPIPSSQLSPGTPGPLNATSETDLPLNIDAPNHATHACECRVRTTELSRLIDSRCTDLLAELAELRQNVGSLQTSMNMIHNLLLSLQTTGKCSTQLISSDVCHVTDSWANNSHTSVINSLLPSTMSVANIPAASTLSSLPGTSHLSPPSDRINSVQLLEDLNGFSSHPATNTLSISQASFISAFPLNVGSDNQRPQVSYVRDRLQPNTDCKLRALHVDAPGSLSYSPIPREAQSSSSPDYRQHSLTAMGEPESYFNPLASGDSCNVTDGKDILDTTSVAASVRSMLVKYNISQRRFAREVMMLSQGTVNDLLTKSKPWDKLTKRGREWYRIMNLWASDPKNAANLRSNCSRRSAKRDSPTWTPVSPNPEANSNANILPESIISLNSVTQTFPIDTEKGNEQTSAVTAGSEKSTGTFVDSYVAIQPNVSVHDKPSTSTDPAALTQLMLNSDDVTQKRIAEILLEARKAMEYEKRHKAQKSPTCEVIAVVHRKHSTDEKSSSSLEDEQAAVNHPENSISTKYDSETTSESSKFPQTIAKPPSINASESLPVSTLENLLNQQSSLFVRLPTHCSISPIGAAITDIQRTNTPSSITPTVSSRIIDLPSVVNVNCPVSVASAAVQPTAVLTPTIGSAAGLPLPELLNILTNQSGNIVDSHVDQKLPIIPPSTAAQFATPIFHVVGNAPICHTNQLAVSQNSNPATVNQIALSGTTAVAISNSSATSFSFSTTNSATVSANPTTSIPSLCSSTISPSMQAFLPFSLSPTMIGKQSSNATVSAPLQQTLVLLAAAASAAQNSSNGSAMVVTSKPNSVTNLSVDEVKTEPIESSIPLDRLSFLPSKLNESTSITTPELVDRVCKLLAHHGISRNLFGTLVLGISQPAVSELFNNPTPWESLTTADRELYQRMERFLKNPVGVIELLALANGALPNVNLEANEGVCDTVANVESTSVVASSNLPTFTTYPSMASVTSSIRSNPTQYGLHLVSNMPQLTAPFQQSINILPNLSRIGPSFTDGVGETDTWCTKDTSHNISSNFEQERDSSDPLLDSSQFVSNNLDPETQAEDIYEFPASVHYKRPSAAHVIWLATALDDLDTNELRLRVKQILQQYSISQRTFGEVALGMCQASISDMLSKPRPWNTLTHKARVPYVRMYLWLQDPNGLEALLDAHTTQRARLQISASRTSTNELLATEPFGDQSFGKKLAEFSGTGDVLESEITPLNPENSDNSNIAVPLAPLGLTSSIELQKTFSRKRRPSTPQKCIYSSFIPPSPRKCFRQESSVDDQVSATDCLDEQERQSLVDIAKAATVAMKRAACGGFSRQQKFKPVREWARDTVFNGSTTPNRPLLSLNSDRLSISTNGECVSPIKFSPTRIRTKVNAAQKAKLLSKFHQDQYPSTEEMRSLASELSLSYKTVLNWFNNRRMRTRDKLGQLTQSSFLTQGSDHAEEFIGTNVEETFCRISQPISSSTNPISPTPVLSSANFSALSFSQQSRRKNICPTRFVHSSLTPSKVIPSSNLTDVPQPSSSNVA